MGQVTCAQCGGKLRTESFFLDFYNNKYEVCEDCYWYILDERALQENYDEIDNSFKKGDRVRYTAEAGFFSEYGVVSSANEKYVFVKYDRSNCIMRTGDEDCTAKATSPENLEII